MQACSAVEMLENLTQANLEHFASTFGLDWHSFVLAGSFSLVGYGALCGELPSLLLQVTQLTGL